MFSIVIPTWNNLPFLHKCGISRRDVDRVCWCRGEPVELEVALKGRSLEDADRKGLANARLRAWLSIAWKPAVAFTADHRA